MNVPLIEEDVAVARAKFAEYRAAVKARHCAEDAAVLACYRQLCRGRKLINVFDAIKAAAETPDGMPQLAIAQADWKVCHFRERGLYKAHNELWHSFGIDNHSPTKREWRKYLCVPPDTFERRTVIENGKREWARDRAGKAVVPTIPPSLRPKSALSNYHILWEAEWQRVPVDPILLKHIGGPVYAVLAMWDLTPVEQAVLSLRSLGART